MSPKEVAILVRLQALVAGETPHEFAERLNHQTSEDIAEAMELLPTDVLEWAVRFEALSHSQPSPATPPDGGRAGKE
jgi:hypothetical protein